MNTKRQGLTALFAAWMLFTAGGATAAEKTVTPIAVKNGQVVSASTEIAPPINLVIGKSTILRLPAPAARISVGNPVVADINLINPREAYLLGKEIGSTNLIIWSRDGVATVIDVTVNIDAVALQTRMRQLMPDEPGVTVDVAYDSIVLKGEVSDALKMDQVLSIADAFVRKFNRSLVSEVTMPGSDKGVSVSLSGGRDAGGAVNAAGARIVNMMHVRAPQQVMLEVKVAEVSKTLLEKLGAQLGANRINGDWGYSVLTDFLSNAAGLLTATKSPTKFLKLDAEKQDGLVRILAEPNIMALSGQTGKFLSGGRIFIPVAREDNTITLEEKEFGIRLAFTPTVLSGGRIHLKVAPEVSELSQTGSPFTSPDGGVTSVLPSFTVRNAETTVQLIDGQSFAIAGLIKNNSTQTVKRFPVLGEIPVIGALFRSSEFQDDKTELVFVVTPRLAKPLAPNYTLPTDSAVPPTRSEFFLGGKMEGSAPADKPATATATPSPDAGGFEMR
ncbi:MAG: type II and III secretion system protein family protein [Thiobacillus sp.]